MDTETTPKDVHPSDEGNNEAGSEVVEQPTTEETVEETTEAPVEEKKRELDPEEMQKTLNKQFNEMKSLKDEIEVLKRKPSGNDNEDKIQELEDKLNQSDFYAKNPDYNTPSIKKVLGSNPAEAIQDEAIKEVVDGKVANDKSEASKSVLKSNPRLGRATNKIADARKLSNEGNQDAAEQAATSAVLDAYGE